MSAASWQGKAEPVDGGQLTFAGPVAGAGVTPITTTATIAAGAASAGMSANSAAGAYEIHTTTGASTPISYTLYNQGPTTTTLTSAPNPSVYGDIATFTATVTATAGVPGGFVTITVGGSDTVLPLVNATATLTRSNLGIGLNPAVATYGGDPIAAPSVSALYTHTVQPARTTIAVTAAPNPAVVQNTVTLTASVATTATGLGTPTGYVTFTAGAIVFTATLDANGVATTQRTDLIVGNHAVSATYAGDDNFATASNTGANLVVNCTPAYVVNTSVDAGAGSLRQALTDVCAGGAVTFDPALTAGGPVTITLTSAQLDVAKNMTITGPGAELARISGNNAYRVFFVENDITANISDLTIRDGLASDWGGGTYGGGLLARGAVTLTNSFVISNTSPGDGGGVSNYFLGSLTISNCTIMSNTAGISGGGIFDWGGGTLFLIGSTVTGNTAGSGAGIHADAWTYLTVESSAIFGNNASGEGGGMSSGNNATMILSNTTVANNSAPTAGGIWVYNNVELTMRNSTVSGNAGGGIYNGFGTLNLSNSIIANHVGSFDCLDSGTIGVNTNNLVENGLAVPLSPVTRSSPPRRLRRPDLDCPAPPRLQGARCRRRRCLPSHRPAWRHPPPGQRLRPRRL
ncbi:MAG: Ig-like domain repeat protein [Anaerolineales bacterium]|nr:Ig-like domain repeat protein [Anaerolineales bacterium]